MPSSWLGKPVLTENSTKFFDAFKWKRRQYELDEYIEVQLNNTKRSGKSSKLAPGATVAQIHCLWEDDEGEHMELRILFRPQDVKLDAGEEVLILASDKIEEHPFDVILGPIELTFEDKNSTSRERKTRGSTHKPRLSKDKFVLSATLKVVKAPLFPPQSNHRSALEQGRNVKATDAESGYFEDSIIADLQYSPESENGPATAKKLSSPQKKKESMQYDEERYDDIVLNDLAGAESEPQSPTKRLRRKKQISEEEEEEDVELSLDESEHSNSGNDDSLPSSKWTSPRANRSGSQKLSRVQELLKDPVALKKKKMQEIEAAQEEIELEADRRLSERPRHKPRSPIGEVIIPEADDWMEQMEMGKTPDVSTFIPQRRTPTKPAARTVVTSPGHTSLTQDRALKLEERTKNLKNFEKLAEDDDDDSIDYITRKSSKITSFFSKVSKAKPSSTSASTTTSAKPKPSLPTSAIYDDDNDDLVFVGEVHSPTKQPPSRTSKTEVDFYRKLITTESRPKAAAIYGDSDDDSQDHTVPEPDPRDIIKKRKQRESPPSDVEEGGELSDLEEPAKKYKKASEKRSKPALKKRRSSDYDELSDVDDFIVADDASVEEYDDELPDEHGSDVDEDGFRLDSALAEESQEDVKQYLQRFATYSIKSAFSVYVQYLAIGYFNPEQAEDIARRNDPYFAGALKRVRDEIFGKKEAIMQSNAWNPTIKEDLDTLPYFQSRQAVIGSDCKACNRRNHSASWEVELTGSPYDATRFWRGKWVDNFPPEKEKRRALYNVGRFCHTRTELYHQLQHFPSYLYTKISRYFDHLEDDVDEADKALSTLIDDEDFIDRLYVHFKDLRDQAMKFLAHSAGSEKDV